MKAVSFLLLSVAWSLGEVQSQVFPFISFMGQTLTNNSYVDLKFVGNDSNGFNNLQCHTDLATCCSSSQGGHRGDWYYPNGSRLQFQGWFYEARKDQVVLLKKENGIEMPSGIYRCDIPSAAFHDDNNDQRESVYVGLYSSGGDLSVVGDVDYSYTEGPYQVNLTTKTVGGPPTTVLWTKNCARAVGDTTAFLNNAEKSEFTHILTIYPAETKGSFFIFTASNNKPSGVSVTFPETTKNVSVPYVMIHAVNATGVRLRWAGRRFFYTSVKYTSIFSNTGLAISHYEAVLPPYVDVTDISLDDYHPGYEHHFTLSYVICNVVPAYHQATATFAFDKKHFQVQFGAMEHCLNWGSEKKDRIEDEIQTHLVRIIRQNCTMCYDLTTAFLRKGSFLCQRNPTHFTYRSTLINPFPTTNSSELLGIIQNWVSSDPTLVLDGLSVRVNQHCPTRIESLEDGECENEAMYDPHMVELMTQVLSVCTVREIGHQLCMHW